MRSAPLSYVLRTPPEPIRVIAGRIGDGVDGFDAGLRLRQTPTGGHADEALQGRLRWRA